MKNSLLALLLVLLIVGSTYTSLPDNNISIIGGTEALPGEIPYIVTLQAYNFVGGKYLICGGSIVDNYHVVTAAHCVYSQNIRNMEVVGGTHSLLIEEPTEQRRNIETVTIHSTFDLQTLVGDIAVIKLTRPFNFNDFLHAIQLAPNGIEPSEECMNCGFGNILNNGSTYYPNVLHKVNLDVLPRSTCRELYSSPLTPITLGMVCAMVPEGGKGACHGDSGGPLTCKLESGQEYLAGIVSWGMRICALPNQPSVFSNIGYYRDFIDEIISD